MKTLEYNTPINDVFVKLEKRMWKINTPAHVLRAITPNSSHTLGTNVFPNVAFVLWIEKKEI